jgi:predicted amidohydrolase
MTRIVCQQLAPVLGDLDAGRRLTTEAIAGAAAAGGEVILLPELATCGYMFESAEEAAACAITRADPLFGDWAAALGGAAVVIGGFCERGEDGRIYNSAAVVGADGLLGVYRKVHLWDREKLWFAPGNEPPSVFATPVGRIGVLVCYDLEFPEMPRLLALAGAQLIAVPTNWPLLEAPIDGGPPELLVGQAAARVNRLFVACCDRAGTERGQRWTQGTAIIDQRGELLARQEDRGAAIADVELARADAKALTELANVLDDRRPELYAQLLERRGNVAAMDAGLQDRGQQPARLALDHQRC